MGPVLENWAMSGENCKLGNPNDAWPKKASFCGSCPGVGPITVAGVEYPFPALCGTRREVASLVGGGVCIWKVSMLSGRGREEGFLRRLAPFLPTAQGSGEEDSLREGSTGGSGRLDGTKWLTWNSGSSGVRIFWL